MIDKINGVYRIICDICEEPAEEVFDDFYDAIDYMAEDGWWRQTINGEWIDTCPECQSTD